MDVANLGPIDDGPVFGACRPGHFGADVQTWTDRLVAREITAVCCLLSENEASRWRLPTAYDDAFETVHVPIRDRQLPDADRLERAVDYVARQTADGNRVALHCNAGLGRTGVVAAAWLVRDRGLNPVSAIETVESRPRPRSPREAIRDGNATEAELVELLEALEE
ncbi:protein-tyrosine phosphatase family protein [Natronolimnohabitans innermongolicus]|uniref:Dual specificity protein phosphatase n=1 Tax=Natronolimnohabitans innermongolicus JCM 12255 TaxID=1227499 RepID=L9WW98_9EURY|nr:dual specificity protein phosphatase family protein [Natronolimnohabitans innermongolicus]ELY52613.1 dual specificity protein phosphatase [Natronolimnohabitans innermongolicus JCM 12255]